MEEPIEFELLAKYLAGQCSVKEAVAVEQWIDASPKNARYFSQLQKTWLAAQMSDSDAAPDTEASWQQLKRKMATIRPLTPQVAPTRSLGYQGWWRVAAVLLVAVGLGWRVYRLYEHRRIAPLLLTESVTDQHKVALTLGDGSKVWLNQYSRIRYPKQFGSQGDREVHLEGEAYFEVARNAEQPFIIHTYHSTTRVLGTSFNVQAYEQDSVITVSVSSGKVAFQMDEQPTASVVLLPQQRGVLMKSRQQLTVQTIEDGNYLSWKTGRLTFRDTPLIRVVAALNRHYAVKITVGNPGLRSCKFTGEFINQPLNEVLEVIKLTSKINYQKRGHQIILKGNGC